MPEEFYWGEITQSEMREINHVAERDGWKTAVEQKLAKSHPGLVGMVTDEDRVDWVHLLATGSKNALDIGSGWGQTSYLLAARHGYSVTSLELIPERAEFQTIRAREEGLDKVTVMNADILTDELPGEKFDLATFIGVLEWVGVSGLFEDPRRVQLEALRNVHKSLVPGGQVCIGIENRIGFNNFLGATDHSGFSFTSLMPRWIASKYLSLRNAQYRSNTKLSDYRTFTYSASGYTKLLKEAGFVNVRVFVSHPHYAHPRCLIPYQNSLVRKFFWKNYTSRDAKDFVFTFLFRSLSLIGMGHLFAPHFIVLADK